MALAPRIPALSLLFALLFPAWQASAQTYPSRTVRIIVPFGPGGPADTAARVLAQHLSETLKQSFVVENRPGAGSIIGTGEAAKAAPDGYTLLVMSDTHTTNESLMPNKPYQLMRDFVAVAPINYTDLMLVVTPSLAAKNLREFIALAKQNPGKFSYASSGQGTAYHMAAELFKAKSGTDIVHVPHRAAGEMRSSVMGGHVQIMFDAISISAPNVLGGKLTALGVTGRARSPILPDVPTMGEAGLSGFETAGIWGGSYGAGRNAEGNRESAQYRDQQDYRQAGGEGGVGNAGSGANGDDGVRIRRNAAQRHPGADRTGPDFGPKATVAASPWYQWETQFVIPLRFPFNGSPSTSPLAHFPRG